MFSLLMVLLVKIEGDQHLSHWRGETKWVQFSIHCPRSRHTYFTSLYTHDAGLLSLRELSFHSDTVVGSVDKFTAQHIGESN